MHLHRIGEGYALSLALSQLQTSSMCIVQLELLLLNSYLNLSKLLRAEAGATVRICSVWLQQ